MAVSRVWVRCVLALAVAACGGKAAKSAPDAAAQAAKGLTPAAASDAGGAAVPDAAPPRSLLEDLPAPVTQVRLGSELPAIRVLASGRRGVSDAIVTGKSVVFASETEGTIVRVPLGGGRFETLARGQAAPIRLAARGAFVYWLVRGVVGADGTATGGTLLRAPLAGGPPQVIASGLDDVVDFALDGEAALVATRHTIERFAAPGAPGTLVASELADVRALALAPEGVFVATQGDATIWRVPRGGGKREPFVVEAEHVVDLVVAADRLVWVAQGASSGEGQVAARPLGGGAHAATTVIADALDRPRAVAVGPRGQLGWLGEGPDGREGSRWVSFYLSGPDGKSEARLSTPHGGRRVRATADGWLLAGASEILFVPAVPVRRTRAFVAVTPAPGQPRALAADARSLYWISYQGAVMALARRGGAPELLAHAPRGLSSMALEGGALVYSSYDAGTVARVAPGSPAVDVATGRPHPIAVATHGGEIYFVDDEGLEVVAALGGPTRRLAVLGGTPRALAVDDEAAFVLVSGGPGGDRLVRVPLAGGVAEALAENLAGAEQLALAGDWIYVLDEEPDGDFPNARGQIWRLPRRAAAGAERERLAAGLMSPGALAVGGGYVWFASGDGRIGRLPEDGGSLETVAGGGRNVAALWPDGGDLLVASGGTLEGDWKDGAILRLALRPAPKQ